MELIGVMIYLMRLDDHGSMGAREAADRRRRGIRYKE
jgi:hypothetical protein